MYIISRIKSRVLPVVERIEKEGRGLNLTWEVRDGILNHQTSGHPHTLEGQVVRISDKLAHISTTIWMMQ